MQLLTLTGLLPLGGLQGEAGPIQARHRRVPRQKQGSRLQARTVPPKDEHESGTVAPAVTGHRELGTGRRARGSGRNLGALSTTASEVPQVHSRDPGDRSRPRSRPRIPRGGQQQGRGATQRSRGAPTSMSLMNAPTLSPSSGAPCSPSLLPLGPGTSPRAHGPSAIGTCAPGPRRA